MKTRIESDLLGDVEVPERALYGAQTMRAIQNFPVKGEKTIGDFPELINGLVLCKVAAAMTNRTIKILREDIAEAIINSAQKIVNEEMYAQFPIHYLHGGGGTSANMNVNEVIANLAEESLGGERGQYKLIHPNDHVNLNQSTNDIYPSACHIAIITKWKKLKTVFEELIQSFLSRGEELENQKRIARTCLQDAVDISFKDFLSGYSHFLTRAYNRIEDAVKSLYTINLGGTIVGRIKDVPGKYLENILSELKKATGDNNYRLTANYFDSAQNPDEMINVSSQLALFARGIIKIAKDFRLLSSGPETGFNEIILPPLQPGSSVMPGKINPVVPEFLIQICFQVIGYNAACQSSLDHGELDLNIWESLIVTNILNSMNLLCVGLSTFNEKCAKEFKVNFAVNDRNADSIIPLLTRLVHTHGYSKINNICKEAIGNIEKLKELLKKNNLLD